MSNRHENDSNPLTSSDGEAEYVPPTWLMDALRGTSEPSAGFRAECKRSAEVALALLRLRPVSRRLGPACLAVPAYLRGLAAAACVPLAPILAWAGLSTEGPADAGFAAAWARLAHALDLELRQALWHLRLTFADEVGLEMLPGAVRSRAVSGNPAGTIAASEEFLARESAQWDPEVLARLRACEHAVREGYRLVPTAEETA